MKFLLNGNEVTPKNYEEIELVVDKTREGSVSSMNLTQLIFVNEAKKLIDEHLTNVGYFTGIPLDIKLDNNYTLNYYLDQSDNLKEQDHQIDIAVKKRYGNIEFWEKARGASFLSLGDAWVGDEIGWVVITTNDHLELLNFAQSFLSLAKQTIDSLYSLKSIQAAAAGVGTWIYAIILIASYIVQFVQTLSQILIFMEKVKEYVSPPVKKLKVTDIRTLIEFGLNGINFGLNDNAFINQFNDIVYLGTINKAVYNANAPLPTFMLNALSLSPDPALVYPQGYPTVWDLGENNKYNYTMVGGFIEWFLDTFNAKISVKNGLVTFNRRDENTGTVNNLTTGLTIQSTRVNEQTPNTNEVWQRCLVRFAPDETDEYTSYLFNFSAVEYGTTFPFGVFTDLNLIRGIKDVNIGFSQGFTYQYTPKKFKDLLQKITNKLSGFFGNAIGSWASDLIYGTIPYEGILATNQPTYNRPKLLRRLGGLKVESITAEYIFKNFHEIDFIGNNSFMIHSGEILECSDDLFVDLDNNDYAEINGEICEVIRVSYSPFKHKATIIYKKPSNYASNLVLTRIA